MLFLPIHTVSAQTTLVPRELKWKMCDTNSPATVVVFPTTENETLTTFDLRTWLALQYHWWNCPDRQARAAIPVSLTDLGATMSRAGAKTGRIYLEGSLRRLSEVRLDWVNSFRSTDSSADTGPIDVKSMTLLVETEDDSSQVGDRQVRVSRQPTLGYRFHERIERNLIHGRTERLDFETAIRLRSELGLILYTLLNGVLRHRRVWRRSGWNLIHEDLGLPTEYPRDAWIRHTLKIPVRAIDGKPLGTGTLDVSLEDDIGEESAASILGGIKRKTNTTPKLIARRCD